jgi:hypothetical protein
LRYRPDGKFSTVKIDTSSAYTPIHRSRSLCIADHVHISEERKGAMPLKVRDQIYTLVARSGSFYQSLAVPFYSLPVARLLLCY